MKSRLRGASEGDRADAGELFFRFVLPGAGLFIAGEGVFALANVSALRGAVGLAIGGALLLMWLVVVRPEFRRFK